MGNVCTRLDPLEMGPDADPSVLGIQKLLAISSSNPQSSPTLWQKVDVAASLRMPNVNNDSLARYVENVEASLVCQWCDQGEYEW